MSTLELVPTDRLAQKCSSGGRFSPARRVRSCARGQSDTSYSARHLRGDASFHGEAALCQSMVAGRRGYPNHARGALSGAPDQMPLSWGRSTLPGGREGARFSSREARRDAVSRRSLLKGAAARRQVPRLRRCPVVVLSGSSLISDARCEDGEPISPRSPRTARRRLPWACDHRRR